MFGFYSKRWALILEPEYTLKNTAFAAKRRPSASILRKSSIGEGPEKETSALRGDVDVDVAPGGRAERGRGAPGRACASALLGDILSARGADLTPEVLIWLTTPRIIHP